MKLNEFAVYADGSIIVTFLAGTIDEHAATEYCRDVERCVKSFGDKPFGCLINGLDTIGCTPKAYEVFDAHNEWLKSQPMVAKAIVVIDDFSKDVLLRRLASINSSNVEIFETDQEAKNWLNQKMQSIS